MLSKNWRSLLPSIPPDFKLHLILSRLMVQVYNFRTLETQFELLGGECGDFNQ